MPAQIAYTTTSKPRQLLCCCDPVKALHGSHHDSDCTSHIILRFPLKVVRPDKVTTTFPHAPDRAPAAQLVCIGFKDGAEVRRTLGTKPGLGTTAGQLLYIPRLAGRLQLPHPTHAESESCPFTKG